jgi:hypothetical protein
MRAVVIFSTLGAGEIRPEVSRYALDLIGHFVVGDVLKRSDYMANILFVDSRSAGIYADASQVA